MKFCSTLCYERSLHLQQQLYAEPLWFSLERKPKTYSLEMMETDVPKKSENHGSAIVMRLNDLKIADNAESSDEEGSLHADEKKDEERFISGIRSYVSSGVDMAQSFHSNQSRMP